MPEKTGDAIQDYVLSLERDLDDEEEFLDREDIESRRQDAETKRVDDAESSVCEVIGEHFVGSIIPEVGDRGKLERVANYIVRDLNSLGDDAKEQFARLLTMAGNKGGKHGMIDKLIMVIDEELDNTRAVQ